jgi:hypothetical protein
MAMQEEFYIPEPIKYRPRTEWIEFPPDPGFYRCPKVSDWTDTTPLRDGDVILTSEPTVTILFGQGLPKLSLHNEHGFSRRQIVKPIMLALQAEHFEHNQTFLERISVDQGLIICLRERKVEYE